MLGRLGPPLSGRRVCWYEVGGGQRAVMLLDLGVSEHTLRHRQPFLPQTCLGGVMEGQLGPIPKRKAVSITRPDGPKGRWYYV